MKGHVRWLRFPALALALVLGGLFLSRPAIAAPVTDWKLVASPHFDVYTDGGAAEYAPMIERLEAVHAALAKSFFVGVPIARATVLLFADPRDFTAVAPEHLSGFYLPRGIAAPGFDDALIVLSSGAADFESAATTAAHELGHHFLEALSDRIPLWLHEGFAKYVGAARVEADVVVFHPGESHRPWGGKTLPLPLTRLFAASPNDFHGASARAQYLTAWLLMRQTLARAPTGPALGPWFQKLVARSVVALTPAAQSAALAWANAGTDRRTLEREILALHAASRAGLAPAGKVVRVPIGAASRAELTPTPADPAAITRVIRALRARARD
jgi:hypothetical protein